MIIDFHSHYYPIKYLKWLENRKVWPSVTCDGSGRIILVIGKGHRVIINDSFYNVKKHIRKMESCGINLTVLSLSNPWVDFEESEKAVTLSRLVNKEIADAVEQYPDKLIGLATLPLTDLDNALEELERAVEELGMKGIIMPSNIIGKPLDSQELWPVYEKVAKLNIPIFLHPATPIESEVMKVYSLETTIGFPFETSLAIARLILSGVFEKISSLKIVAAHLGGAIPYLIGRIDRGYTMFQECKANISKPPSTYLKKIYLDTISFHKPALTCAYESVGPSRLVFGTDYPFPWTTPASAIREISELNLSEKEKCKIFYENAADLLCI
jgi:aminocarboxymuconate-semialdehyde decarboxylase